MKEKKRNKTTKKEEEKEGKESGRGDKEEAADMAS